MQEENCYNLLATENILFNQMKTSTLEDREQSPSEFNQQNPMHVSKYYLKKYYKQFGSVNQNTQQDAQKSSFQKHIAQQLINMDIDIDNHEGQHLQSEEDLNDQSNSKGNKSKTYKNQVAGTVGTNTTTAHAQQNLNSNSKSRSQNKSNYNKLIEVLLCPADKLVIKDDQTIKNKDKSNRKYGQQQSLEPQKTTNYITLEKQNGSNSGANQVNQLPKLMVKYQNARSELSNQANNRKNLEVNEKRIDPTQRESFTNLLKHLERNNQQNSNVMGTRSESRTIDIDQKTQSNNQRLGHVSGNGTTIDNQIATLTVETPTNIQGRVNQQQAINSNSNNLGQSRSRFNFTNSRKQLPQIASSTIYNGSASVETGQNQRAGYNKTLLCNDMLQGKKIYISNTNSHQNSLSKKHAILGKTTQIKSRENEQMLKEEGRLNTGSTTNNNTLVLLYFSQLFLQPKLNAHLRESYEFQSNTNPNNDILPQVPVNYSSKQQNKPPHPQQSNLYQRIQRQAFRIQYQNQLLFSNTQQILPVNQSKQTENSNNSTKIGESDQFTAGCIELRKLLPSNEKLKEGKPDEFLPQQIQNPLSPQSKNKINRNRLLQNANEQNHENLQQLIEMLEKNKRYKRANFEETQQSNLNIQENDLKKEQDNNNQKGNNYSLKKGQLLLNKESPNPKAFVSSHLRKNSDRILSVGTSATQKPQTNTTESSPQIKQKEIKKSQQEDGKTQIDMVISGASKQIQVINILNAKKNNNNNSTIGFQSYSVSPKVMSIIQSKSQLPLFPETLMNSQDESDIKPFLNTYTFNQIIQKYPNLMNDSQLTEEAQLIFSLSNKEIDILTIEIKEHVFKTKLKDDLEKIFGSQILKWVDNQNKEQWRAYQNGIENRLLDITLTTNRDESEVIDEQLLKQIPISNEQTFTIGQSTLDNDRKKLYVNSSILPITGNLVKPNMNGDLQNLMKINALESTLTQSQKQFNQKSLQAHDKLQKSIDLIFPQKDYSQCNVQAIIKYSDLYDALKHKYNLFRKQNQNKQGLQFVATRDITILNFIIEAYNCDPELPKSLLSSINHLILVIKSEQKPFIVKKDQQPQQLPIEKKSHKPSVEVSPEKNPEKTRLPSQSPKYFQAQSKSFLENSPQMMQIQEIPVKKKNKLITQQKRAFSSTNMIDGDKEKQLKNKKQQSQNDIQLFQQLLAQASEENLGEKETLNQDQAKIKIYHQPYTHLRKSRINKAFRIYNEFIQLTFKNKEKQYNTQRILQLGKFFGLQINSKQQITEQYFKNKETALPLKEKLIMFLLLILNQENDIQITNYQEIYYRYYIGTGNNSLMVRNLMKQRWWWCLNNDKCEFDDVNFIWTQWRKTKVISQLKTYKQYQEDYPNLSMTDEGLNTSSLNNSFNLESPTINNQLTKKIGLSNTVAQSLSNLKDNKNNKKKQQKQPEIAITDQQPPQKQTNGLQKMYNKLEDNFHLSNKKALFLNMRNYYEAVGEDISISLPLTFHIKSMEDPEFQKFKEYYMQQQSIEGNQNIWILKPGENTNRGTGIEVRKELTEIQQLIEQHNNKHKRTVIVQKYIHNPLLINKRKFDIRCYALVTSVKGNIKAFFYKDGYLRTSSKEFTLVNLSNRMIHLTNDAVQKYSDDYGKYENGNKLSYEDFQKFLNTNYGSLKIDFFRDLLPQIQKIVTDSIRATFQKLDPNKRINAFEIFGYDFMFDDQFKIYLIEANTNPCLELSSPLLAKLIPQMVENAFRIGIDPIFPPPENFAWKKSMIGDLCQENKFELVFDERVDGPLLSEILKEKEKIISNHNYLIYLFIVEIDEEEEEMDDEEVVDD